MSQASSQPRTREQARPDTAGLTAQGSRYLGNAPPTV
jgi:hypothetical protein